MSDTPIRQDFRPSYDAIPSVSHVAMQHRRSSTFPTKKHFHLEIQHSALANQPLMGRRMTAASTSHNHRDHRMMPAVITPAPFETRGGMFVPGTPAVFVPPRPMVAVSEANRHNEEEESDGGVSCSPCCSNQNFTRRIKTFFLGQLLSLCLCGTGISSELLAKSGFNAPAGQSFATYFFLFFVYGVMIIFREGDKSFAQVLRKRWWKYFLLAIIDVEANYLIVKAYQYTNLTSIQVLDCTTIISVLVLSYCFLAARYHPIHFVGVTMSFVGSALIIWIDTVTGKGASGGSDPLLGDSITICATLLYAISNTTEEFLVKQYDRYEYLGMVGMFGMMVSSLQFVILERDLLTTYAFTFSTLWQYSLFTVAMFTFYSLVSVVMERSSALMFNLSVLTADFYSLLAGIFIFSYTFNYYYLAAFFLAMAGSFIYSLKDTKTGDDPLQNWFCRLCCNCCPWVCDYNEQSRLRQPYTVRDAEQEQSSLGTPQSDERTTPSSV